MTQTPSLISVNEQAWGEISPRAAIVHFMLTDQRWFSGRAALDKAVELRKLVVAFRERAIAETAITLEGASLDVSTGLFSKSSSVTYRVRVTVPVEQVAEVLDVLANAKQATLTFVEWDYASGPPDELVAECSLRAVARAKHVAQTLGVAIAGVHAIEVHPLVENDHTMYPVAAAGMVYRRKSSVSSELAGLELAPTKKIGVRVEMKYALRDQGT
jgi:hypothetical protein